MAPNLLSAAEYKKASSNGAGILNTMVMAFTYGCTRIAAIRGRKMGK
jgi:hypothetical protein